jgi:hypothetical protein
MRPLRTAGCAALALLCAGTAAAQEPTLATVLERAGAYVLEFQRQLSGIVAEEHYVQNVPQTAAVFGGSDRTPIRHRELISDLLLIRPVGADRWIQFRDVFDVDRKPVRDRNERLARLFLEPTRSTADQVRGIVAESTRYNIGDIQRTVNVPVMPLVFLDPKRQARFKFERTTNTGPSMLFKRPSTTAWAIQYQEVERDTMIRGTNEHDLPSRGRFWVEPATGRVVMTELIAEDVVLRAMIVVGYREDATLGLLVPAEMREQYDVRGNQIRRDASRVEGRATYSNFRRFTVTVDEKLAPVVKP